MDSLSLPLPNVVTITLKGNGNDILRVTVMTHLREFLNCSRLLTSDQNFNKMMLKVMNSCPNRPTS